MNDYHCEYCERNKARIDYHKRRACQSSGHSLGAALLLADSTSIYSTGDAGEQRTRVTTGEVEVVHGETVKFELFVNEKAFQVVIRPFGK